MVMIIIVFFVERITILFFFVILRSPSQCERVENQAGSFGRREHSVVFLQLIDELVPILRVVVNTKVAHVINVCINPLVLLINALCIRTVEWQYDLTVTHVHPS